MIGKINGIFKGYYGNIAIIEVGFNEGSIGYEVVMKNNDILSLKYEEKVEVFIKEIVKEDDDILYGFLDFEEKCFFEELIKLNSLGPKIAMAILSTYSCESIIDAIQTNNCSFFSSVSGIGSKLANRIPNEMMKNVEKIREKTLNFGFDKTNDLENNNCTTKTLLETGLENLPKKSKNKKEENNKSTINKTIIDDAVNALISLGFSKQQIYNDVFQIVKNSSSNTTTQDIVKQFLKDRK